MKRRKLYILTIWGKERLALLDDYQANFISNHLYRDRSEHLFTMLDGIRCGTGSIEQIVDVEKNFELKETYALLNVNFPDKTSHLFMENDYCIINNSASTLSFKRITTNEQLIQFVFGNQLAVNTRTVSVKVKVQAECNGTIEIPDYYTDRDFSTYIKSNMDDFKIDNISCDLSNPVMNYCDICIEK